MCVICTPKGNNILLEVDTHIHISFLIVKFKADNKIIFIFKLFDHFIHKIDHQPKQTKLKMCMN